MRKHDPHICCLQETHLRTKDLHRLKVKGWKQIFQANGQEKKAGEAILISAKIDFKKRAIKRDPEGHFIILKGRFHQEDIKFVYAPNIGASKYIKKILEDFKKDVDRNTIIVWDFNTPVSKKDRSSKQNINEDIVALNNALDEMDLIDIESLSSQRSKIHILFKCTWNIFKDRPHDRTQNKPQQVQEN